MPIYPVTLNFKGMPFEDRRFPVDLAAFSPASLQTVSSIEEPSTLTVTTFRTELDIPEPTIGDFYMSIIADLEDLNAIYPAALFIGDLARQLGPDYYWSSGGELSPVHDLTSAKNALLQVIGQAPGYQATAGRQDSASPLRSDTTTGSRSSRTGVAICRQTIRLACPPGTSSASISPRCGHS
ncbi:ferritin-like protein [Mesorhizobium sp. M1227]